MPWLPRRPPLQHPSSYDEANTWIVMRALEGQGLVELVPGVEPQRWRVATRYRGSAVPYVEVATLIRAGEWASYGDISIAVHGTPNAARAVGRAAAKLRHFPNAHRVLGRGGIIPDGWRSHEGLGPEECQRRLEAEGVRFTDGHADPARHITWEELRERGGLAV